MIWLICINIVLTVAGIGLAGTALGTRRIRGAAVLTGDIGERIVMRGTEYRLKAWSIDEPSVRLDLWHENGPVGGIEAGW